MSNFFDYFQVTSFVLFLFVLAGRALYLRFTGNINPIAIGRGKRGFQLVFELYAFVGLAVWMVEVLLYSLHTGFRIFPSQLDMQLIDSTAARVIGVMLMTFGIVI